MAQIRLGIGQVNITEKLIARARKTTTPLVIEASRVFDPPHPVTRNVVLPAVGDIDPVIYYVDFYESNDGITLGILLTEFVVNARNNLILSERRYYYVGGPQDYDPPPYQDTLTDAYLDGKTIFGIWKTGLGRPLVPPEYTFKEYDPVAGGGFKLLNGQIFAMDEIWVVDITYAAEQIQVAGGGGFYDGVVTLTENTTLGITHRKKGLNCQSNASSRQVHTLEDVATVPEGSFYYFFQNGGNQFQTKVIPFVGQSIFYNNTMWTEMTIAPGEYLRIEKIGAGWVATMVHPGVLQVGERISAQWETHPNTKPENGALFDGDDWPRPWDFVKNKLPLTHKIVDDNVINGGYVHPVGKEGLFVMHSSLKKFRMPNTQGWSERGLKSFTVFNTDATRTYDYPGGTQPEAIKKPADGTIKLIKPHVGPGGKIDGWSLDDAPGTDNYDPVDWPYPDSTETRGKNVGVIYCRRF